MFTQLASSDRRLAMGVSAALVLLALGLIAFRVLHLGYQLSDVLPESHYRLTYHLSLDGHEREAVVRTFLPQSDQRQEVLSEDNDSPGLFIKVAQEGPNRRAIWSQSRVPNKSSIDYSLVLTSRALRYELPKHSAAPQSYASTWARYLEPEEAIQVDHPEIHQALKAAGATTGDAVHRLRAIYKLTSSLPSKSFKGTTDALTALRLGEASCNGKSRLFVALARATGLPARLVGGLILEPGSKKTSHQWVEVYINGHWIPFCPTNGHFAELPAHYLTLYRGDHGLFSHTADVNFDYEFETTVEQVPSEKAQTSLQAINVLAHFQRLGLPFSLLRTMLMLPLGALIVVICRNVAGIPTFGTFLPALIAAAMLQTGALWGTVGLLGIVLVVALVRLALQSLQLLHSPTLAVLLAVVTGSMLATSLVAEHFQVQALTRMTLFPIAVLAITAERFYVALVDRGAPAAMSELLGTLLVIYLCYLQMRSIALQSLIVGFPEVLLVVVALDIYLGTWTGIRLSEHLRFRRLLLEAQP